MSKYHALPLVSKEKRRIDSAKLHCCGSMHREKELTAASGERASLLL